MVLYLKSLLMLLLPKNPFLFEYMQLYTMLTPQMKYLYPSGIAKNVLLVGLGCDFVPEIMPPLPITYFCQYANTLREPMWWCGHGHGMVWSWSWYGVVMVMVWCGHGHGLVWSWSWYGVVMVMVWCGHGHGLVWSWSWFGVVMVMVWYGHTQTCQ